ncbi:MAG: lipopolysaccharide assembly protein LapA domain-containing protein [bacterium]|nr:lipopolysaccharide assembly protein LapA domain-containing protein [bacterium]
MAFWRVVKILFAALLIFLIVNFFLSNSAPEANSLAAQISFKFNIPPFLQLESIDFSVGYLLLIAFTIGMLFATLIGALHAFGKGRELKMKKKTIHELEKEIDELRDLLAREKHGLPEKSTAEELNRLPEEPEIH